MDGWGVCRCCGYDKTNIRDGQVCGPCRETPPGQTCRCGHVAATVGAAEARAALESRRADPSLLTWEAAFAELRRRYVPR